MKINSITRIHHNGQDYEFNALIRKDSYGRTYLHIPHPKVITETDPNNVALKRERVIATYSIRRVDIASGKVELIPRVRLKKKHRVKARRAFKAAAQLALGS